MHCKDTRIVVNVGTNKPFSGRIYALGRLALVKFQTIFHNHYSYRLVVPVIESQTKIFFLQKRNLQRWCHQQRHIQVIIDANGDDDADDDGNDWWQKTWSCRKVIVITPQKIYLYLPGWTWQWEDRTATHSQRWIKNIKILDWKQYKKRIKIKKKRVNLILLNYGIEKMVNFPLKCIMQIIIRAACTQTQWLFKGTVWLWPRLTRFIRW